MLLNQRPETETSVESKNTLELPHLAFLLLFLRASLQWPLVSFPSRHQIFLGRRIVKIKPDVQMSCRVIKDFWPSNLEMGPK